MVTDTRTPDSSDDRVNFELALGAWAIALLVFVPAAAVLESPLGIALGFLAAPAVGLVAHRRAG